MRNRKYKVGDLVYEPGKEEVRKWIGLYETIPLNSEAYTQLHHRFGLNNNEAVADPLVTL